MIEDGRCLEDSSIELKPANNYESMETNVNKISSTAFYETYHGHTSYDLEVVHRRLRTMHSSLIFLAGDSSLDNKVWFPEQAKSVNGYELILQPPKSKQDIAYWMNHYLEKKCMRGTLAALNCAVEESTIAARACGHLLPQDEFIRDNIQEGDILVISVGGNDVALRPAPCTILSIASLLCCTTTSCIKHCSCGCAFPVEDYMFCGPLSNLCACPPGLGHMVHLFGQRIQSIVTRLVAKRTPKLILVCMIYFLDEKPGNSWAELTLSALGYNSNPEKLQEAIRQIFRLATQQIRIPGTKVVAVPLFEVLDGKNTSDYAQRVEPSALGGEKMSHFLCDIIMRELEQKIESVESSVEVVER